MNMALYRRYRPESFAEVIGQSQVTVPLTAALRSGKVNHAYLFSGPRGCGKTTSARILARTLNCEKNTADNPIDTPCGQCPSCISLSRNGTGSLDVVEIDAASHGGVDAARELRERATFIPSRDHYKIFIIDEAHMVTKEGFNALLKVVEEPPPHIKFIFATTEPEKVLGTIRSRTQHYPFRLVPPAVLGPYLEDVCAAEGVTLGEGVLALVLRAGGGSVRDSLSVLDQLIAGSPGGVVEYEGAIGLLGYTPAAIVDDAIAAVSQRDGAALFQVVARVIDAGTPPARFVEDLLERVRDLIVVKISGPQVGVALVDRAPDEVTALIAESADFELPELSRLGELLSAGLNSMVGAIAPQLQLELLIARLVVPSGDTREDLLARLAELERQVSGGSSAGVSPRAGSVGGMSSPRGGATRGAAPVGGAMVGGAMAGITSSTAGAVGGAPRVSSPRSISPIPVVEPVETTSPAVGAAAPVVSSSVAGVTPVARTGPIPVVDAQFSARPPVETTRPAADLSPAETPTPVVDAQYSARPPVETTRPAVELSPIETQTPVVDAQYSARPPVETTLPNQSAVHGTAASGNYGGFEQVQAAWPNVAAGISSPVTRSMLTHALGPVGLAGDIVTIAVGQLAIANRLNDPRQQATVSAALSELLGRSLRVTFTSDAPPPPAAPVPATRPPAGQQSAAQSSAGQYAPVQTPAGQSPTAEMPPAQSVSDRSTSGQPRVTQAPVAQTSVMGSPDEQARAAQAPAAQPASTQVPLTQSSGAQPQNSSAQEPVEHREAQATRSEAKPAFGVTDDEWLSGARIELPGEHELPMEREARGEGAEQAGTVQGNRDSTQTSDKKGQPEAATGSAEPEPGTTPGMFHVKHPEIVTPPVKPERNAGPSPARPAAAKAAARSAGTRGKNPAKPASAPDDEDISADDPETVETGLRGVPAAVKVLDAIIIEEQILS